RDDLGDLEELTESIRENGILSSLVVTPTGSNHYIVIAGHRRLAAAKIAGLKSVPCGITTMTQEEQVSTMLQENVLRGDLSQKQQAQAFKQLSMFGWSADTIADKSGFKKSHIKNQIKIADAPEEAFEKQATIDEHLKILEFADDPKIQEYLIQRIGTSNFKFTYDSAISDRKLKEFKEKWEEENEIIPKSEHKDIWEERQQGGREVFAYVKNGNIKVKKEDGGYDFDNAGKYSLELLDEYANLDNVRYLDAGHSGIALTRPIVQKEDEEPEIDLDEEKRNELRRIRETHIALVKEHLKSFPIKTPLEKIANMLCTVSFYDFISDKIEGTINDVWRFWPNVAHQKEGSEIALKVLDVIGYEMSDEEKSYYEPPEEEAEDEEND
ncbi:ParB/RepB/Spo0J family partition protein, partial [Lachnospiraceae bacterium ZAX-1]